MLANYLIGLREGLEAALVVSILVAYLVRSGRQDALRQVWIGIAVAVTVSLAVGAALTFGPQGLSHQAQEAIGGGLSILAVGLLTWMIFWMAATARTLKAQLHGRLDAALVAGGGAVMLVTLLAVGREGLETALFLWAAARATGQTTSPLLGAALGLLTAIAIGWALYRGALRLDLRRFFSWTGLALVVVAAGVLAYGVHDLQEAGLLPGEHALAFDVSATIPKDSWYGTLLRGTVNFTPATTWLQAAAWLLYASAVGWAYVRRVWGRGASTPAAPVAQPAAV